MKLQNRVTALETHRTGVNKSLNVAIYGIAHHRDKQIVVPSKADSNGLWSFSIEADGQTLFSAGPACHCYEHAVIAGKHWINTNGDVYSSHWSAAA